MAKQTYSKEERKAQFLKTGVALAKKDGLDTVTAATVAAKHEVTAPLVFHIFGSRDKLRAAIKREAKKQGVALAEPKKVAKKAVAKKSIDPKPARKRNIKEVKAIKDKAAGKRPARAAGTKVSASSATGTKRAVGAKKAAAPATAGKPAYEKKVDSHKPKFATQPAPTTAAMPEEPKATI